MVIRVQDVTPMPRAELPEPVMAGTEKISIKNSQSHIALIDADRLDYSHQLERERVHLLLINEASQGLDDVAAGRIQDARSTLKRWRCP